ncbi:hypothetical protein AC239_42300 [Bacteroides fragilis]|nr:hypothetical protein AC239_42300 [Bacteroides fragilis]OCR41019.1 hypothetical protein AC141_15430 [Bacteroides fragilis]
MQKQKVESIVSYNIRLFIYRLKSKPRAKSEYRGNGNTKQRAMSKGG